MPTLLQLSDPALRVCLNYLRFANRRTGLSYPCNEFLLRVLGSPMLYTCFYCGGSLRHTTRPEREKRLLHVKSRLSIVAAADGELCERGLARAVTLNNKFGEFSGRMMLQPGGAIHQIPKRADAESFFILPDVMFTTGAAAIWERRRHGYRPLSPPALRLLLVLMSEYNLLRYGGVRHTTLSIVGDKLQIGGPLRDWPREHVLCALAELIDNRNILTRASCVASRFGHMISYTREAQHIDEIDIEVFLLRNDWTSLLVKEAVSSLLVSERTG